MDLSFIDRLVNHRKTRLPESDWQRMRVLKAAIRRDLTDLLNTRLAAQDFDQGFENCTASLLRYGIPDFTSYTLESDAERQRVKVSVERAIRQFEPRLARVKVTLEKSASSEPRLHFTIEAQLRDKDTVEDVRFDARVLKESRRIAVTGEGD